MADVKGPSRIWRKGDLVVVVGSAGDRKNAVVILASENGRSLALQFEGMFNPRGGLGGFVGMMPLLWVNGRFETFDPSGIDHGNVTLEERRRKRDG